jgi:hypothetical protein
MARTSEPSGRLSVAGTLHFLGHLGEMIAAMFMSMAALGAFWGLVLAALGTSSKELLDSAPAFVALGLSFDMTVPMALWMRHRGHSGAEIAEMAGAMGCVGLIALALLWTSAIRSDRDLRHRMRAHGAGDGCRHAAPPPRIRRLRRALVAATRRGRF